MEMYKTWEVLSGPWLKNLKNAVYFSKGTETQFEN